MPDRKKKARMFSKKASFLKSLYSLENIYVFAWKQLNSMGKSATVAQ